MRRATFCILILLLSMNCKCKKSVEGESETWAKNTQRASELMARYPAFKVPLQKEMDKARQAMESAKKVADEEESAKKMSEVNKQLSSGLMGSLGRIERSLKQLKSKIVDASSTATDQSDRQAARLAAEEARRTMSRVETAIAEGSTDKASARALLRKARDDLSSAEQDLDRVIRLARKKKRQRDKEKKARQAKAEAREKQARKDKQAKEKAEKPWKCEYCGSLNEPKSYKCKSCGAPRP